MTTMMIDHNHYDDEYVKMMMMTMTIVIMMLEITVIITIIISHPSTSSATTSAIVHFLIVIIIITITIVITIIILLLIPGTFTDGENICTSSSSNQTKHWPSSPGPWFNIKTSSYQYRKFHSGDKTILRPSYLHNGISYTGKTTSLYWIGALLGHETMVYCYVVVIFTLTSLMLCYMGVFIFVNIMWSRLFHAIRLYSISLQM